jgi:Putative transmembrane protein (PGPGW)
MFHLIWNKSFHNLPSSKPLDSPGITDASPSVNVNGLLPTFWRRCAPDKLALQRSMGWMSKIGNRLGLERAPRIRKVVVAVIGGTVMLIGVALLVLPGPATVVIPIGLVILASEFAWARHVLQRGKRAFEKARRGKWRDFFSRAGEL